MSTEAPKVIVLAGPNGAGKTTASKHLLQGELQVPHFVNAHVIARGLSGFAPESVAFPTVVPAARRVKTLLPVTAPSTQMFTHTVPLTVAPLDGLVMKTLSVPPGGGGAALETVTARDAVAVRSPPSVTVSPSVCEPSATDVVLQE